MEEPFNLIYLIPASLLALPLRLKSKDSPCSLIHVTFDLLVFLRGLVFRRVILIHVANVPVFKQELGGSFDLTLVRREVEHVPLRPMALTLVFIYCRGKKALRCAYLLALEKTYVAP